MGNTGYAVEHPAEGTAGQIAEETAEESAYPGWLAIQASSGQATANPKRLEQWEPPQTHRSNLGMGFELGS